MTITNTDNTHATIDSHSRYRIIILLSLVILAYCIFAYPYVFNTVDMIKYRMRIAESSPPTVKGWVFRSDEIFSQYIYSAKIWGSVATEWLNKMYNFFKNVQHDFII
jgi:hypothetical protein